MTNQPSTLWNITCVPLKGLDFLLRRIIQRWMAEAYLESNKIIGSSLSSLITNIKIERWRNRYRQTWVKDMKKGLIHWCLIVFRQGVPLIVSLRYWSSDHSVTVKWSCSNNELQSAQAPGMVFLTFRAKLHPTDKDCYGTQSFWEHIYIQLTWMI